MKYKRQAALLKIIKDNQLRTHEQLIKKLKESGFNVTQATVSRDIKELGIIKVPSEAGTVYAEASHQRVGVERNIKSISDTVLEIDCALHTVVIKTYPGMASAVGASLDNTMKGDFLGSIAGDDVLLIIAHGIEEANALTENLRRFFKCPSVSSED